MAQALYEAVRNGDLDIISNMAQVHRADALKHLYHQHQQSIFEIALSLGHKRFAFQLLAEDWVEFGLEGQLHHDFRMFLAIYYQNYHVMVEVYSDMALQGMRPRLDLQFEWHGQAQTAIGIVCHRGDTKMYHHIYMMGCVKAFDPEFMITTIRGRDAILLSAFLRNNDFIRGVCGLVGWDDISELASERIGAQLQSVVEFCQVLNQFQDVNSPEAKCRFHEFMQRCDELELYVALNFLPDLTVEMLLKNEALRLAIVAGNSAAVKVLVEHFAVDIEKIVKEVFVVECKDCEFGLCDSIHEIKLITYTPLYYAVKYGKEDIAAYLVSQGANPEVPCGWYDRSVLHRLVEYGLIDLTYQLLERECDAYSTDTKGRTIFYQKQSHIEFCLDASKHLIDPILFRDVAVLKRSLKLLGELRPHSIRQAVIKYYYNLVLELAVCYGTIEILKLVEKNGFDVSSGWKTTDFLTNLAYVVGNMPIARYLSLRGSKPAGSFQLLSQPGLSKQGITDQRLLRQLGLYSYPGIVKLDLSHNQLTLRSLSILAEKIPESVVDLNLRYNQIHIVGDRYNEDVHEFSLAIERLFQRRLPLRLDLSRNQLSVTEFLIVIEKLVDSASPRHIGFYSNHVQANSSVFYEVLDAYQRNKAIFEKSKIDLTNNFISSTNMLLWRELPFIESCPTRVRSMVKPNLYLHHRYWLVFYMSKADAIKGDHASIIIEGINQHGQHFVQKLDATKNLESKVEVLTMALPGSGHSIDKLQSLVKKYSKILYWYRPPRELKQLQREVERYVAGEIFPENYQMLGLRGENCATWARRTLSRARIDIELNVINKPSSAVALQPRKLEFFTAASSMLSGLFRRRHLALRDHEFDEYSGFGEACSSTPHNVVCVDDGVPSRVRVSDSYRGSLNHDF